MKKYITKRKWDKLFDSYLANHKIRVVEDNIIIPADAQEENLDAFDQLNQYTVIGVRHQFNVLFDRIENKFCKMKWGRQRAKRGFADSDLWNLGDYVIDLVLRMLRKYREDKCIGYPCLLEEDFYKEHDDEIGCSWVEFFACTETTPFIKNWQERCHEECRKKWHDTIDEMIALFSEAQDENLSWDHRLESCERAFSQFGKWAQYVWL